MAFALFNKFTALANMKYSLKKRHFFKRKTKALNVQQNYIYYFLLKTAVRDILKNTV